MILALFFVLLSATSAFAQGTYNLAWDPAASTDVFGYSLIVATTPGGAGQTIDAGNGTTWQLSLDPGTFYVRAVAYYAEGVSGPSNELTIVVPGPPPPPPPPDPCVDSPLAVNVTRWPTNNGGKNLAYTSNYPIVTTLFTSAKNQVTAILFTDTRGCQTTVSR